MKSMLMALVVLSSFATAESNLKNWNTYVECQASRSKLNGNIEDNETYFPGPDQSKYVRIDLKMNAQGNSGRANYTFELGEGKQILLDIQASAVMSMIELSGTVTVIKDKTKVINWTDFSAFNNGVDPKRVYLMGSYMNPLAREVELTKYMPTHGGQPVENYNDLVKAGLLPAGTDFLYGVNCLYLRKGQH